MSFDERHRRFMRHFDPSVRSHVLQYKANMARLGRCIGYGCDEPRTRVKWSGQETVFMGSVETLADLPKQAPNGVHRHVNGELVGERGYTAQNTKEHCDKCVTWARGLLKSVCITQDVIFRDGTAELLRNVRAFGRAQAMRRHNRLVDDMLTSLEIQRL